jgi:hypothetical protein
MSAPATSLPSLRRIGPGERRAAPPVVGGAPPWWKISWSKPAAYRAVRATVVMPTLFALTYKGAGNLQMALFAGFGSFATLVMASFGGTRKDKLLAHLGLAVAGSAGLAIGTLASGHWWLAAIATIGVAFAIFFAGVISPNAAAGTNAALLSFVLPVASPGGAGTIPDRLAGWWLASIAGTAAVLLLSVPGPGDRLRSEVARLADALADQVDASLRGDADAAASSQTAMISAKHRLMDSFTGTPYRPTGLATADQALSNVVATLEWCAALLSDAFDGHLDLSQATDEDRDLLRVSAVVLRDVSALLRQRDAAPDLDALERARRDSVKALRSIGAAAESGGGDDAEAAYHAAAAHSAHAQAIAVATRSTAADALIASRRADPDTVAMQRRRWYAGTAATAGERGHARETAPRAAGFTAAMGFIARHASARSVWMVNSLRGAAALAAAVAVADLSGVQHGFWVVLGTLSVLRTNAASTGANAWRALAGTTVGFIVGAALILGIGTGQAALWAALPIAVLVASYAPGTAPFLFGQAAFTVTVAVLFNLLVPVGWKVGLLRIEDVAIGCGVSLVVGVLFWPRGAGGVVGADLADAFRRGAEYLTQSVEWATGARPRPSAAGAGAVTASIRLDDALRSYLTEQGSKRVAKDDMWRLVMGTTRLRLTANVLAGLHATPEGVPGSDAIRLRAAELALYYERVADEVGPAHADEYVSGDEVGLPMPEEVHLHHPHLLWVFEHLEHLRHNAQSIAVPAARFADVRRRPWWR